MKLPEVPLRMGYSILEKLSLPALKGGGSSVLRSGEHAAQIKQLPIF